MIRDFWVKNYLSIRDKQELNFLAKGPSSELVTEVADGVFLYKLGILYGSNASKNQWQHTIHSYKERPH